MVFFEYGALSSFFMCNGKKQKQTFFRREEERTKVEGVGFWREREEKRLNGDEKKARLASITPFRFSFPKRRNLFFFPLSLPPSLIMAATAAVKPAAAAASSSHVDGHDEALPAPRSHLLLLLLSLAPAFLPIPANANIVATASLAVFVGCWRSVKQEAPTESMTRKVRTMMKGKGKRERSVVERH